MAPLTPSAGVALAAPPKQSQPAKQKPVGAVRPGAPQKSPAGQLSHSAPLASALRFEKEPAAQRNCTPEALPLGQKLPGGQALATAAPATQNARAGQGAQAAAPAAGA